MNFGCILSPYDSRDYKLKSDTSKIPLPSEYSCPLNMKVKNQGQVSSCVAHAISSILEYHAIPKVTLSTNFIYGIQKKLFNREGKGMMLRDACKIAVDYGDMLLEDCAGNTEVPESYKIANDSFADSAKLSRASEYRILKYFLCRNTQDIKYALYNYGPVLASIKWFDNYKVDRNGILSGKSNGDYDNHAIVIYGYTSDGFWCQNSWGKSWGKEGRFFVPNGIKFNEARCLVDWNGSDELKEPNPNSIVNLLYKGFNLIVNFIRKLIKK